MKGALQDCLRLDSLTSYAKPGVWGEDMGHGDRVVLPAIK